MIIDPSAKARIDELRALQNKPSLKLRVTVDGGGCSGFQYDLKLTEETQDEDLTFDDYVLSDALSLTFLKGSTISFKDDLIGSEFIITNPNAVSGCGCGTSFSV